MNSVDLVTQFEGIGVTLWEEDGQLRFRAPKGVMTADRVDLLREHKEPILDVLRSRGGLPAVVPDRANRYSPFPLTDIQAAYLLGRGDGYGYGGVACHAYVELGFPEIDPERFQAAWNALIRRHDMLRAVISKDGYQRVLPEVDEYRIEVLDRRGADQENLACTIAAVRERRSHEVHDTQVWPLFSLQITLTDAADIVHFSIDFLIADFVSIGILMRELTLLYLEDEPDLAPLPCTFRDYLTAANSTRDSGRWERDRQYWIERIDELAPAPELPVVPQDSAAAPRFHRLETVLDAQQWSRLRAVAKDLGITPSTAVLAGYAEIVGRWSAAERFTLNLTVLNRPAGLPGLAHLVGDFTSVTLLEVAPEPADTLADRAKRLQAQLWQDIDHNSYSGIEVIRELARRRGQHAALMPVVFTSAIGIESGPDTPEVRYGITQTPQVHLDCQAVERADTLVVNWDVRAGVFPAGLVEDMFAAFADLLRRMADGAQAWRAGKPVSLPTAQRARRELVNATAAEVPRELLHEPVLRTALREPGRPALWSAGRWMTYGELAGRAHALAEALTGAGCRPRDLVAIVLDKGWEQVVGVLGTLIAGGVYLPLDTNQPLGRRDSIMAGAGVRFVLTQSSLAATVTAHNAVRVLPVDTGEVGRAVAALPERWVEPGELAYVIYTSGSTGTPKGVMITHQAAVNTVHDINQRCAVGPGDRVLGLANLGFDLSVFDIFGPLAAGAALVLPQASKRGDPGHWAELIEEHGVTFWNSVPAQLQMLHDFVGTSRAGMLDSVRIALLSGDWVPVSLVGAIRAQFPHIRLISLGGATEAAIWSIWHPIETVSDAQRSIPYGRPLTNQRFHVLDQAMRDCPDWVPGELYIAGLGIAQGYRGDAEQTARCFPTHPVTGERLYRTGDLGRYLPDGEIEFLGRRDRQVKIRGHRIELAEVEVALEAHPAVAAAATLVQGDRGADRRLVAFIQTSRRSSGAASGPERLAELAARAGAAGEQVREGVDVERYRQFARRLDGLALSTMVLALQQAGLFTRPDRAHTLDEVLAAAQVAPKHHRLIRRWFDVLEREGLLRCPEPRRYLLTGSVDPADVDAEWDEIERLAREVDFDSELLGYLRLSTRSLPELMRDDMGALQLVFPEGRVEIWEAAYKDNLLSRWMNRLVTTLITGIARDDVSTYPVRILEFGAGVGGTTAELLPALDALGTPVDYLFTDISHFFLNDAKERFAEYPWIRYGLFDLNVDHRSQGFEPNSFDIIVSGHVMHYAKNAGEALGRLRELLAPGGWLIFVDLTRDNYQIMTSMMFLGEQEEFHDLRRETGQTFLDCAQWTEFLSSAGAASSIVLPRPGDVFSSLGQHVFVATFKTDREPVRAEELMSHLADRLPEYMIPAQIHVLDALPLNQNGKINHNRLVEWLPAVAVEGPTLHGERPRNDLEQRIAAIWMELLNLDEVARTSDFFELGGDSLQAARFVGRVRDEIAEAAELSWDGLVREFLPQPTIASLASHLESAARQPGQASQPAQPAGQLPPADESPLVYLSRAVSGPAVVLVHGGAGNLTAYEQLIHRLGTGTRVLGLQINDRAGYLRTDPASVIESVARGHVQRLLDTGEEALHLVGYHVGGVIAAEVARQLAEQGVPADRLTVVSSFPLPCEVDDEPLTEYLFALSAGLDPVSLGFPSETQMGRALASVLATSPDRVPPGAFAELPAEPQFEPVRTAFAAMATRSGTERQAALSGALGTEGEDFAAGYALFRHGLRAGARHQPGCYAGDITLLRHTDPTPLWPALRADMTQLWSRICLGRLTTTDIDGGHFTCLRGTGCVQAATAITGSPGRGEPAT